MVVAAVSPFHVAGLPNASTSRQFSRNLSCWGFRRLIRRGRTFCTAAAQAAPLEVEQRSEEWHELRKDRLTASTFANALGLFKGQRLHLWEEKIGAREPFKGNRATRWGEANEFAAVQAYKQITGHLVEHIGFKVYKDAETDCRFSWLGASPDGLIEGNASGLFDHKGVLEVKCPHMRGRDAGVPWSRVPYYYIPQAQGLLEILDRDWMDFYVWTGRGSASFRITRNPDYWKLIEEVLSEFWWDNVIPARDAKEAGEDYTPFEPVEHPLTASVLKKSRELGDSYPVIWCDSGGFVESLRPGLNLTLTILAAQANQTTEVPVAASSTILAQTEVSEQASSTILARTEVSEQASSVILSRTEVFEQARPLILSR